MANFKEICDRPNGERVWALIFCSSIAWLLSILATSKCSFMVRQVETEIAPKTADVLFYEGRGVGFWGWESAGTCYSYVIGGQSPSFDAVYGAARAFTGISDAVGGMAMVCAWMTSCFLGDKMKFRILGLVFIVVAFFEMLSLIFMMSSLCKKADFFSYALKKDEIQPELEGVTSSCSMATGSALAATSGVFWLLSAIAARLVRPPKADDATMDMATVEDFNIETPKGEMSPDAGTFGDADDDDDDDDGSFGRSGNAGSFGRAVGADTFVRSGSAGSFGRAGGADTFVRSGSAGSFGRAGSDDGSFGRAGSDDGDGDREEHDVGDGWE